MRYVFRVLMSLLFAALGACAQLQPRPELPAAMAIPPGEDTPLDRTIASAETAHPGQSAFRLIVEGPEAFVSRMHSARMAARSLDVQTYIWHADTTGLLLANELISAADRGVKIRLLLDDMDARARNAGFAALAAHPNIDVRMFNPFASREGTLGFIGEGMTSFGRINRRMHNKTWIADNRIAIAGGRNLGDEYFGASDEVNFVDLDFAMVGPVVRDASASFDKYWNSPSAYPMELLDKDAVSTAALDSLRERLAPHVSESQNGRYAAALRQDDSIQRMLGGDWSMRWTQTYQFISDDPHKVTMTKKEAKRTHVGSALVTMVRASEQRTSIISPYFVPGDELTSGFAAMVAGGRQVRILTNSLVANDVAAVHGGYSRYRKALLEGGVQLWELKPLSGSKTQSSLFGSSGASLHTKAFAVDGRALFVGSYNLDPRSTWLNCEQGVLVEDAELASQLESSFATQVSGDHAWRVQLQGGKFSWSDGQETFDSEPKASAGRRFQAWLARVLHLDAQL
ncbi:MAG TPA: phospholipase D family protein [Povalibacter sp.]